VSAWLAVVLAQGPTAVWYHYPIGYGRSSQVPDSSEKLEAWKAHDPPFAPRFLRGTGDERGGQLAATN